jgi:acetyltransferase-like isoleucine patch superfamily enzyme
VLRRLVTVLREEVAADRVPYRLVAAGSLVRLLPFGGFIRARTALYRLGGVEIGTGAAVLGPLRLWGMQRLTIGAGTSITTPCAICLDGPVTIGANVLIGHDVVIATGAHEIGPHHDRGGALTGLPVTIGDGVWLGAGVLVLPGVTIGAGAVVAGGAVVTRDVEPDTLVGGVPARSLRTLRTG